MEKNKKRTNQLILLDLNKAFDSVWHNTLIINENKIPSTLINIITSYLHDKKFYVSINGTKSTCKKVIVGSTPELYFRPPPFHLIHQRYSHNQRHTHTQPYSSTTPQSAPYYGATQKPPNTYKILTYYINLLQKYFKDFQDNNPVKTWTIMITTKKNLAPKPISSSYTLDYHKYLDTKITWAPAIDERMNLASSPSALSPYYQKQRIKNEYQDQRINQYKNVH